MGISIRAILLIVWFITFIPGAVIHFTGIHEENWKKMTIGSALDCVSCICLLLMTFID